jgi:hypothetical protein
MSKQKFPNAKICKNSDTNLQFGFLDKNNVPDSCEWKNNVIFPKVSIVGAGIAGLTAAYELVRAWKKSGMVNSQVEFNVTVYEKSSYAGGKIIGFFRENTKRPIEHSTRIYGINYVAMFDMLKNIPSSFGNDKPYINGVFRCVLDDLVPMFVNYVDAREFKPHFAMKPNVSAYETTTNLVNMILDAQVTKKELSSIIQKLQTFYNMKTQAERLSITAGLSIGEYLEYPKISQLGQQILNSLIGVIVAARVQCDAYSILCLFESLGYFGSPKTSQWIKDSGIAGGNCFPGPSSSYLINPIVKYLQSNGVRFNFNTQIVLKSPSFSQKKYDDIVKNSDAVILATPHMVTSSFLGSKKFPEGLLKNEWSFGIQFYITDINQIKKIIYSEKNQNIYNVALGSPWQIIYVIEWSIEGQKVLEKNYPGYKGFWGKNSFGEINGKPIIALITATVSNQYNPGLTIGKSCLQCTPAEMCTEILAQCNIDSEQILNIIKNMPSFGSIKYIKAASAEAQNLSVSWVKGPVQSNGMMWISDYTLYIKTAYNPTIGSKGMCNIKNYAENPLCQNTDILPTKLNLAKNFSAWHYEGLTVKPSQSDVNDAAVPTTFEEIGDKIYLAGEYCETPNAQIPTMEKACESAKVAVQKIIQDFGIIDPQRLKDLKNGKIKLGIDTVNKRFIPATALVQVEGLEYPTELVNFVDISPWDNFRIFLFMGGTLQYPPIMFAYITFITVCTLILAFLFLLIIWLVIRKTRKNNS